MTIRRKLEGKDEKRVQKIGKMAPVFWGKAHTRPHDALLRVSGATLYINTFPCRWPENRPFLSLGLSCILFHFLQLSKKSPQNTWKDSEDADLCLPFHKRRFWLAEATKDPYYSYYIYKAQNRLLGRRKGGMRLLSFYKLPPFYNLKPVPTNCAISRLNSSVTSTLMTQELRPFFRQTALAIRQFPFGAAR